MVSRNVVFWEVDTQADLCCREGKLMCPGLKRLLPNIRRLTDAARQGARFSGVATVATSTKDDPEFKTFPPHCIKGTPGSSICSGSVDGESRHRSERAHGKGCRRIFSHTSRFSLKKQTLEHF